MDGRVGLAFGALLGDADARPRLPLSPGRRPRSRGVERSHAFQRGVLLLRQCLVKDLSLGTNKSVHAILSSTHYHGNLPESRGFRMPRTNLLFLIPRTGQSIETHKVG